ncbi:hypothetical protein ACTHOQ_17285 [Solibacillus silvestris]|uniref:hypothetical protein n=1 Tax=Solibacillus silvestris TaxID=76853 RepID=UPI003F7EE7EB
MNSFQTIEEANEYFERLLDNLLHNHEQKQQSIEINEQQIRTTLKRQYEQQLSALEQQRKKEEAMLKRNSAQAIGKIKILFENKKGIILKKYKDDSEEEIKNYEVNKMEMLEQKQADERAKFKAYIEGQKLLLAKSESVTKLNVACEQAMDEFQQGLMDILEKYKQLFDELEQQYEGNCDGLQQRRDEAIESLFDNEEASQNQLDDQLFEALQHLDEEIDGQRNQIEQGYIEKKQSLDEMVYMQRERNEMEYEQQRERLFELQEQVLAQFD